MLQYRKMPARNDSPEQTDHNTTIRAVVGIPPKATRKRNTKDDSSSFLNEEKQRKEREGNEQEKVDHQDGEIWEPKRLIEQHIYQ